MSRREKKNPRKWINVFLIMVAIIAIIGLAVVVAYMFNKEEGSVFLGTDKVADNKEPITVAKNEVQIYKGTDRPIAVMIDNNKLAQPLGRLK